MRKFSESDSLYSVFDYRRRQKEKNRLSSGQGILKDKEITSGQIHTHTYIHPKGEKLLHMYHINWEGTIK